MEVKESSYLSELVVGEAADERRLADLGVADDDHRTLHPRSHRRSHRAARSSGETGPSLFLAPAQRGSGRDSNRSRQHFADLLTVEFEFLLSGR